MKIDNITLELGNYTQNANFVKEIVLQRLLTDNVINEEQAQQYSEKWNVIVIKKGWFKRWMDKFSSADSDEYFYKFVKFED
jgi:hypothetical protein